MLGLIDRGWIEVRRVAPWTSPSGRDGIQDGELVPRAQLPAILEEPASWEYPDGDWIGALTLVETEAGEKISRLSPEEIAEEALRPRPAASRPSEESSPWHSPHLGEVTRSDH
ncbi:hypothetical protein GXW82_25805 [Streptacidiphilus sp. 4-A2]|nr:hypothetical protein [Streptacidiphilus sp. 4-A2]